MEVQTAPEAILDKFSILGETTAGVTVTPVLPALIDTMFTSYTNLTTNVLGAKILSVSDEYFAAADNLLTPTAVIRKAGFYVHTGAWFDGWESRRHNQNPYDWVVIKLGCVGEIEAVEIDTSYFSGNEAPAAGLDGCFLPNEQEEGSGVENKEFAGWQEVLPQQPCGPSMRQAWRLSGPAVRGKQFTHLRLKMYPDGGIARLKVYGRVIPAPLPARVTSGQAERPLEDLASALNGGVATDCNDQHFGVKSNLILPGRGKDMGDGWETSRSRAKGHVDWALIRLGLKGRVIEKVVVDTAHFRGNFPRAVKVEGWAVEGAKAALGTEDEPKHDSPGWIDLIKGERACQADFEHEFEGSELASDLALQDKVWTHVKLTMIPDGGVKRIRIFGRRA